jgi:tetratricopeptide (TPR) repeat protein
MNDLFAIQSDVAESIVAALQVTLSSGQRGNIQHQPSKNMKAYDIYLRGKEHYERRQNSENEIAIALFELSIEEDPTFPLAYVGLANCYIERSLRFDGGTSWLDLAIDLCRKAIKLSGSQREKELAEIDGNEARAHTALAWAMMYKNQPEASGEAVAQALKLAPDDIEANFWAAVDLPYSRLDKHALFLKCRSLDQNDPSIPYNLASVCLFWEDNQLGDKWLQRAIHLESNEERKHLLSGEQLVYKKNYRAALDKLQPFSPAFVAYGPYVEDLKYGCWEHLGQWANVLQLVHSSGDFETDRWRLLHLILALNATQQENEAQQKARRLLELANEDFTVNPHDRYAAYFLAFCYRFLGEKDKAYTYLRQIFPEIIGWLPLGRNDYPLRIFSQDPEMQLLMADLDKDSQEKRIQIHQMDNDL